MCFSSSDIALIYFSGGEHRIHIIEDAKSELLMMVKIPHYILIGIFIKNIIALNEIIYVD